MPPLADINNKDNFIKQADEIKPPPEHLERLKKIVDDSLEELEGQDIPESTREEFKNMEKETPDTSVKDMINMLTNKIEGLEKNAMQSNLYLSQVMASNSSIQNNISTKRKELTDSMTSTNDKLDILFKAIKPYKKWSVFFIVICLLFIGGVLNEYKDLTYPLIKSGVSLWNDIKHIGG